MRPVYRWLPVLPGLLLTGLASAQTVGYASGFDVASGQDSLFRITLETGAASRIGPLGFLDVEGLAFHPDGSLYGAVDGTSVQGGGSDLLIRIDSSTGAGGSAVALRGLAGMGPGLGGQLDYGLASTCDGQLWLSSDTLGHLWRVNRQDGSVQQVISGGPQLSALASRNNYLYGISIGANESLYRVHTETWAVEHLGPLGLENRIYDAGLDFDADGRLWATLDYLTPPDGAAVVLRNDVVELDPANGRVLRRMPITGAGSGLETVQMEGLAIAAPVCGGGGFPPPPAPGVPRPVPAAGPLGLAVAALSLLLLAGLRLRRG
jgi:hypothetical protein